MRNLNGIVGFLVAFLPILAGCTVQPVPMAAAERREQAIVDLTSAYDTQEPITRPITLYEAMARAIKYNLDYRQKLMETAVASGELDLSRFNLLPQLTVSAGYQGRSNPEASHSQTLGGAVGNSFSTSEDRDQRDAGIAASWNILDFGVSYVRARQFGDRVLIAKERRRRVLLTLLSDVRGAYWRFVGAQMLATETEDLTKRIEARLQKARAAQNLHLSAAGEVLALRRDLLTTLRRLTSQREALKLAKTELANLMNLRPGTPFEVATPDLKVLASPPLSVPIETLEEAALALRPELAEENYQARITRDEATAGLLSLLPGIRLTASRNYDSNSYLLNDTWTDAGIRVSYNLLNLLTIKDTLKLSEARQALDRMRRLAFSVAVITQVNLAHQAYLSAVRDLSLAAELDQVEQATLDDVRGAHRIAAASELPLIQAETRALAARLDLFYAYASMQTALGRIYSSIGLSPLHEDEALTADLKSMTNALREFMSAPIERQLIASVGLQPQ